MLTHPQGDVCARAILPPSTKAQRVPSDPRLKSPMQSPGKAPQGLVQPKLETWGLKPVSTTCK